MAKEDVHMTRIFWSNDYHIYLVIYIDLLLHNVNIWGTYHIAHIARILRVIAETFSYIVNIMHRCVIYVFPEWCECTRNAPWFYEQSSYLTLPCAEKGNFPAMRIIGLPYNQDSIRGRNTLLREKRKQPFIYMYM